MEIPIYQIDAFTEKPFYGNPAAVCVLEEWLDEKIMQNIAMENNLSETAFIVKKDTDYEIRWFTPKKEIDLCGHATLAAAYLVFNVLEKNIKKITFMSQSGDLEISKEDELITLVFPVRPGKKVNAPKELIKGLGIRPKEVYKSRDYMALVDKEEDIKNLNLNMEALKKLDAPGIIVTAKGKRVDFVSRFFAPKLGVDEDPVTGSAHCTLIPYWSDVLNKDEMIADQLSPRGGRLYCKLEDTKVKISGKAVIFLEGKIHI